jgi:hypothetical protein
MSSISRTQQNHQPPVNHPPPPTNSIPIDHLTTYISRKLPAIGSLCVGVLVGLFFASILSGGIHQVSLDKTRKIEKMYRKRLLSRKLLVGTPPRRSTPSQTLSHPLLIVPLLLSYLHSINVVASSTSCRLSQVITPRTVQKSPNPLTVDRCMNDTSLSSATKEV